MPTCVNRNIDNIDYYQLIIYVCYTFVFTVTINFYHHIKLYCITHLHIHKRVNRNHISIIYTGNRNKVLNNI